MKTLMLILSLLLIFFVLSGCEGAPYPLSDSSESTVEEQFVGSWLHTYPDEGGTSYLTILEFSDHEYLGFTWEAEAEDEMMMMSLFSSNVNGAMFANMQVLGDDDEDNLYFIFKYELTPDDVLIVYPVNDDRYEEMSDLDSIAAVHQFFAERMNDPDFFEDEIGMYRSLEQWVWPWGGEYPDFGK